VQSALFGRPPNNGLRDFFRDVERSHNAEFVEPNLRHCVSNVLGVVSTSSIRRAKVS
jgi:hypothetical protein